MSYVLWVVGSVWRIRVSVCCIVLGSASIGGKVVVEARLGARKLRHDPS